MVTRGAFLSTDAFNSLLYRLMLSMRLEYERQDE